ncbi:holo-[acyl-carrier-protein] synthase [Paenibacillus sp. PK3_47]|uniref:holo-ACP synthase n=1 Tax=Paenibacillus sp. PK3_47 TaxID=2072642 RepID=UPI00201DA9AF|nr:holo-ACP synthase [Paenibacillus sp. PK3_47]UQZ34721.1 holo-[acyl-carrier-protein] synthase [Paenibacillus sp. PK3_47]
MIYGIGHDVLEIGRIKALMNRGSGKSFLRRVLTEGELELARQRTGNAAEFAAGRFAAKEAVVKALGCGIGSRVGFQDIEILPDAYGKPEAALSEKAWERLGLERSRYIIHITITHSRELASTFAVVEQVAE